jgi:hypothetical protein
LVFAGLPKTKATTTTTPTKTNSSAKVYFIKSRESDTVIDSYFAQTTSSYLHVKLGIAMLTTFGLIGTGAHQAGFFDIETEPTSVVCAHDNHDNVEVGNVQVDLNLKGEK